MAGADPKSFLGTLSPWSTPRSSTPQLPDRPAAQDVLQRSQGEDHTVSNRHRLSLHHYPPDCPPLRVRWYYAVDSPKRKPARLEQKKTDQKPPAPPKKFIPFSPRDSLSIETAFQKLSDIADSQRHANANQEPTQHAPTKVPVNEDYLFDVDVEERELSPAYWIGPVYEVRRGTWFLHDGSSMKPCEENLATQLEEGYLKLRPWRADARETGFSDSVVLREHTQPGGHADPQPNTGGPRSSESAKAYHQSSGNGATAASSDPRQYRLFGAYMNRIVAYQDASTAWITTDDFMSRFSTTVFQKLGAVPGTKVIRGSAEPRKPRETLDGQGSERKSVEKNSSNLTSSAEAVIDPDGAKARLPEPSGSESYSAEAESMERRPKSTLERQMSSLAGEPQNPAELEEQARRQEEQEMEESREVDDEDREREIDHLVLVTHGIGQRLGLRLESINFIHDVNVLRKTLKGVYRASPDLQALNTNFDDKDINCRVQVLPVCWRHLLDFPYRGVRQNRKELDLTDADMAEDSLYPSLADITLESVPAVRNLISDLAMDVLLYQSGYCEHISTIVKEECNRILRLYRRRNPSFNGSVSLCGHSLGSAILFDILCHQSQSGVDLAQEAKRATQDSDHPSGSPKTRRSTLDFECEEFFCLGSPIALFQMLKGKTIAGCTPTRTRNRTSVLGDELESQTLGSFRTSNRDSCGANARDLSDNSAIISAPKCRDLYNIFHPSDPVSYRIEPLISPAMASLKPQPLPSVKKSLWTTSGQSLSVLGTRMGQSVGSLWSNFTSGVASSLLNRSLGLSIDEPSSATGVGNKSAHAATGHERTQSASGSAQDETPGENDRCHTLIDPDIETLYDGFQKNRHSHRKGLGETESDLDADDHERRVKFEDAKVRALNFNGRVDYSIQE
ncbi:hypothetical protein N7462_009882 [Penicillium macrosclerotiorum]|uniref:uncharacterized protein n=1 Tax=Penicillium macrosclerotiorum TaxID=303699 RepID=UPI002547AE12|nr:uncharacterized protein N7462_009882 [Penicillium macrosclerotiorum]KAJ5668812.1 hypothetical protein N7462_009882 [Penicillium macrosclerotiorum]